MAKWTSDQLMMFPQETSPDIASITGSPALVLGLTLSASPGGQTTGPSGPPPAPVNLSARQAKAAGLMTSGTYGPASTGSSASAALSLSLGSRLRSVTALLGSTLYQQIWKVAATPAGRSLARLAATAPRKSESACIGWPSATARDCNRSPSMDFTTPNITLNHAVLLSGWPLPSARDWKSGDASEETLDRNARPLSEIARLAGWPAAQAKDHFPAHTPEYIAAKMAQGHGMQNLNDLAQLTAIGPGPIGYLLGPNGWETIQASGQLNPAHSAWLMSLPPIWDTCAIRAFRSLKARRRAAFGLKATATQSLRASRRNSSAP